MEKMISKMGEDVGEFEQLINYSFRNKALAFEALTTPQYGNEEGIPHYESLEILGDAVLKLVLILKQFKEGENDPTLMDPGKITQAKQMIENDEMLTQIAIDYFQLQDFVIKSPKQKIEGTTILADILEAVCGAIYLDSDMDIQIVEKKIVDVFYNDWEELTAGSSIFNKNTLLEYLQQEIRSTPKIQLEFEKLGPDHDSMWIAKNPKIVDAHDNILSFDLPEGLNSKPFNKKQKAEKNIYYKILKTLQKRNAKN